MRDPVAVRVPFCGLPCAPLLIQPGTDPLVVEGGCAAARAAATRATAGGGPRVGGRPATLPEALDRTAAILAGARRPHLFGLAWSTVETARRAVRLARRLGGSIDLEGGESLAAEFEATAQAGLITATFGAVRDRADVVVLWGADPRAEHPDLLPAELTMSGTRRTRRVILLAPPGAPPGSFAADLETIQALRARLSRSAAGADDTAAALAGARFVALVWDPAAARGAGGTAIVTAIGRLVRDLDARGRAVARSLGAGGNLAGATSALLSETGLPRALRFERPGGGAAFDPFVDAPLRERGDRILLVGVRAPLGGVMTPAIVVGPDLPEGSVEPEVFIPTAVPGLSGRGTWMRADGVALPVRGPLPPAGPLEEEILDAITARLPARSAELA